MILGNCDDKEVKITGATELVRKFKHSYLLHPICHVFCFLPGILMSCHLSKCVMSSGLSCLWFCVMFQWLQASCPVNARDVWWQSTSRYVLTESRGVISAPAL